MSTTESKILLSDLDDDQVRALLDEHGSANALANAIGMPSSTLKGQIRRRGIVSPAPRAKSHGARLSRDGLLQALQPPNLCPVKAFLDDLHENDQALVNEALDWPSNPQQGGMSHKTLRQWLLDEGGFAEHEVPSEGQIENHRRRKGGCRCPRRG